VLHPVDIGQIGEMWWEAISSGMFERRSATLLAQGRNCALQDRSPNRLARPGESAASQAADTLFGRNGRLPASNPPCDETSTRRGHFY